MGCEGLPDTGSYYIKTDGLYVGYQVVGKDTNIVVNNQQTVGFSTSPIYFIMMWDVSPEV